MIDGTTWDAVVVGAGHNGLTCAAYLAEAGWSVLVLERRDVVGGAASITEPWPGYRLSPCAYLAGLLHPRVIDDLALAQQGLDVTLLDPQMVVPIEPGLNFVEWLDPDRTLEGIAAWSPGSVRGFGAMQRFWADVNERLRPDSDDDIWLHEPPTRDEIERRLGGDRDRVAAVFERSVVDDLQRYLDDERLVDALAGQGIIGTNASPTDPGTAFVRYHHGSGRLAGGAGDWGFVRGGIGMVSETIRRAAVEAGARVATGLEVVSVRPGRGVVLADGRIVDARRVVSNADPIRTARLLDGAEGTDLAARVESWGITGVSAKVNAALTALPEINGMPRAVRGQIDVGGGVERLHRSHRAAREGRLDLPWAELYFQTAYDHSVAPDGMHSMSAFVQYAPDVWADGSGWDDHREEVASAVFAEIGRWSPGFAGLVDRYEVSGPPDIEREVGLTGGHIFQGDCLPGQMFDGRMPYRTGADGVYLCGASTHPGGSVIAVNGRNAAMAMLADASD